MALIDHEWQLVLRGKEADHLVEILQDYELDIFTPPIQNDKDLLNIYVWSLIIAGNYLDLHLFLERIK